MVYDCFPFFNEIDILKLRLNKMNPYVDRLILGQDIFGRDARFERVEIDDTYPEYLREHLSEYEYLVMPPITSFVRFIHRYDLTVGRFFRKAYHHVIRRN